MKYFKILFSVLLFSIFLNLNAVGHAETNNNILSEKETNYLSQQLGYNQEEINDLPIEIAKQLVNGNAKIIDNNSKIASINDENTFDSNISTFGSISSSTLKLTGTTYKVTSDRSGYDKFYIYANFLWLETPSFVLVDKMTFGFPGSAGFSLPISNGVVTQHQHRYSHDVQGNGIWTDYAIDYSPSDWQPNAGVAGDFDLRAGTSLSKHKGYMGQYVYVPTQNTGTLNIKVTYGHKRISGSISVGLFPYGIGITPTTTIDTIDYGLNIYY